MDSPAARAPGPTLADGLAKDSAGGRTMGAAWARRRYRAVSVPPPWRPSLQQLQRVYETVRGRELDKSAFRRRMLDAGFLAEAGPVSGESGRAAMGYRIVDRERATVFPRTFRSGE